MTLADPKSCPPEEAISAYANGAAAGADRQALEDHIDGCARCQAQLVRVVTRTVGPAEPGDHTQPIDDRLKHLPAGGTPGRSAAGARLERGQRLGRYLIVEGVGAGGMGTVYAAYDTLLDRKVALKVLTGGHAAAPARVLAEAAAMARLQHPNVVTVHDVGVVGGLTYLSMELVDGVNLAQWRRQQPRSYRQIAHAMAAAARGLAAAHAAGIIHRDVKPHNILVSGTRVLVTDFGVSIRAGREADGSIAGTPAYMAPEQFRGDRVDARSDVFGFCATLYEMLHGEPPFPGTSREEVRALVASGRVQPPPARSRAPARLHRLALRGLEPDPARRPADMAALADELLADPGARRRNVVLAAAALATVVGAFWGGGYLKGQPERACLAGGAVMDATWNDGRRAQLRQRYTAAGALASWPVLERALDAYAGGWRAAHADTCSATYGKRVQSDEVFDLRMSCLAGQRTAVATFVAALDAAAPRQLVLAAGAGLPALADCQITGRAETRPRPADAAARAQLAEIERQLAASLAQQALGDGPRATASASAAVVAARKLGYQPVLAAALIRLSVVQFQQLQQARPPARAAAGAGTGTPAGADAGLAQVVKQLEEAYAAAELGRDDRQRLAAAREQIRAQLARGNLQDAELWARMGEALLSRLGNPAVDAAQLALHLGWLRQRQGRGPEARAAFQRALELARALDPPDRRLLAEAQADLCTVLEGAERGACRQQARARAVEAHGPDHPAVRDLGGGDPPD
jgi:eukaryotic-like serine/threonine-protein kinase